MSMITTSSRAKPRDRGALLIGFDFASLRLSVRYGPL
jgi:hypothetical protein